MMKTRQIIVLWISCLSAGWLLTGCQSDSPEKSASTGKPQVYVAVPPYETLIKRLGGDYFEVHSLVTESDNYHTYSPTPKQVVDLAKAALFFSGEMPFEEDIVETLKGGKSRLKVVSLSQPVTLLEGVCQHDHEHDHDHEEAPEKTEAGAKAEEHEHEHHDHDHGSDPHYWLSPAVLKSQAKLISAELKNFAPAEAGAQIDENLQSVLAELDSIDKQLAEKLAFMKGKSFYVYHGAFAYLARDYGINQVAIELGNKRPEPKQLAALVEKAKEDNVKMIFVQPQFDKTSAQTLAEAIGAQVIVLDHLERDIFSSLKKLADTIVMSQPGS